LTTGLTNDCSQVLWKVDGDYDAINADIMDWQQLKSILTDRFVRTKATAPMFEHLVLPLQEVRSSCSSGSRKQEATAAASGISPGSSCSLAAAVKCLDICMSLLLACQPCLHATVCHALW
jgi:hypothetical protein